MKQCRKCKNNKQDHEFHRCSARKDGLKSYCIECCQADTRKYFQENSHKAKELREREKQRDPSYRARYLRAWKLKNPEYYSAYHKKWLAERPGYKAQKKKELFQRSLKAKLIGSLRSRLYLALKGKAKSRATMEIIGCSAEQLIAHIEQQFLPGMTWNNWGKGCGKWNIDHVVPFASESDLERLQALNHYSNLKPLWEIDNLQKGGKL